MIEDQKTYLRNSEAHKLRCRPKVSIVAREDSKHQRTYQKALDLDPASPQLLDEIDREEVSRHVAGSCDDQVAQCVAEEHVVLVLAGREADFREKHGLVQIRSVKGYVKQKPARGGADEGLQMFPLAEVDEEGAILGGLCVLGSGVKRHGRGCGSRTHATVCRVISSTQLSVFSKLDLNWRRDV